MSCCSKEDLRENEENLYSGDSWLQSVAVFVGFGGVIFVALLAISIGGK